MSQPPATETKPQPRKKNVEGARKSPEATRKSEETRTRILEAALEVFRERGFEQATMREIATVAKVATGAAYYYFESKDAIVTAFYERAQGQMAVDLERVLAESRSLEERMRGILSTKLAYFAANRKLLGALSGHADPEHPLSPFSSQTRAIREQDIAWFEQAVRDSKLKLPKRIAPYLPRLFWLYQMGLLLFWVYDKSPNQWRTALLFDQTLKGILLALKLANLPLLKPAHAIAAELLEGIYGKE